MPIIPGTEHQYFPVTTMNSAGSIMNGGNSMMGVTQLHGLTDMGVFNSGSTTSPSARPPLSSMSHLQPPQSSSLPSSHPPGGTSSSRKRAHDGKELIYLAKKMLKLHKDILDPKMTELFIQQSDLNVLELSALKKRSSALQQFLMNHSCKDPEELMSKLEAETSSSRLAVVVPSSPVSSLREKPQATSQQQQQQRPEIKIAGNIPVATSTTLPPAVARLSQQQGGTPLDPSAEKSQTNKFGRLDQDQIAEKAKQEAYVLQRVAQLQREGLWFEKRLPKVAEPTRNKAHWDYLLEEMQWIATDFAQERKWKKAMARKIAKSIQKYFQEKKQMQLRAERAAEQNARKIASYMARGVKQFWNNVGKLVDYKQTTILDEKRKQALDQHLSFIVGETEKFSTLVAESMNKPAIADDNETTQSQSDGDFHPSSDSGDDEETIEKEETNVKKKDEEKEVELLKKEREMSLDDILDQLPPEFWEQRAKDFETNQEPSTSTNKDEDDDSSDFTADGEDTSDDEETLAQQENVEGSDEDHAAEMKELEADNELSIGELRAKYGARGDGLETPPVDEGDVEMESDDEEDTKIEDDDFDEDEEDEEGLTGSEEDEDLDDENTVDDTLEEKVTTTNISSSSTEAVVAAKTSSTPSDEKSESKEHELSFLLKDPSTDEKDADKKMNDVAALAESIQPKGYTLSSTSVVTPVPFLLKFPLREYQHVGLDWLVTMFERNLNGILADEMGLGKTIQTIALLAHLACVKNIWGPHLIVVPTSVMLNWEMELKRWCPAFKVLTYYGTIKERRLKRQGWTKPNTFHVCITSYKLVIQDHQSFRRKKWHYLILDEAQNIKNFKSQRWQLLLNFNSDRRLLLTGTPLQNNLNELWSLMHFLMPSLFQSHNEFQAWFSMPMKDMIEGNTDYNENIVKRLHKVLRPFLLRRLKCEVEKQLPKKYEHVVMCRLSNRQKYLYDDFMSRTKTKETLANGTMLSVINILMQLRKVCNHPNLFEERATISPFHMNTILYDTPSLVFNALEPDVFKHVNLEHLNLNLLHNEMCISLCEAINVRKLKPSAHLIESVDSMPAEPPPMPKGKPKLRVRCKHPNGTVRVVIVNNSNNLNKSVKTEALNLGNLLVRQIICQGGLQGLSARNPTPVNNSQIQSIPVQLVHGSRQIKILASAPRVLVQKSPSGQMVTSLIKLPAVISQASSNSTVSTSTPGGGGGIMSTSQLQTVLLTSSSLSSAIVPSSIMTVSSSATGGAASGGNTMLLSTHKLATLSSSHHSTSGGSAFTSALTSSSSSLNLATPTTSSSSSSNALVVTSNPNSSVAATVKKRRKTEQAVSGAESSSLLFVKPSLVQKRRQTRVDKLKRLARINEARCGTPYMLYGEEVRACCTLLTKVHETFVLGYEERVHQLQDMFNNFLVFVPSVTAPLVQIRVSHPHPSTFNRLRTTETAMSRNLMPKLRLLHPVTSAMCTQFPDPRLIQYDCGKLQSLDVILRKLKIGGHRVLIFTQMTRMLDVLEAFLNFHGHIYLRLDGTTKVDQRQLLMETFNKDPRIFCFILSTRSGGVGVNLTGADTVIFYDSDWNPTMDAQAQDRCHRIGQTRDVHIYRLISEKTIEENILKKANQKRLLGDLAIEGGNFTTAYFKSSTIQDLFNVDKNENDATKRMADVLEPAAQLDKTSMGVLENALAAAEDATDVAAAKCAKAELVADLAEFDENIPVTEASQELSKAEQEVNALMEKLSGVERWAIRFYESKIVSNAELVAQAEAELEQQKKEWELERLATIKREEARRRDLKVDSRSELLTFSRDDATNQVWIGSDDVEIMPLWSPPTPPQDDNDVYVDFSLLMLYEADVMPETQLPSITKKDKKRIRAEMGVDGQPASKIRHREDVITNVPRSLFDRPSPQLLKMRHDIRMQKHRGISRPPMQLLPSLKAQISPKTSISPEQPDTSPDWLIHEDMALLQAVMNSELHPNLIVLSPAHTPNWDLVADLVNQVSRVYRSPKFCQIRYETVLILREEGKLLYDPSPKKSKTKNKLQIFTKIPTPQTKSGRPMRTSQLYAQDNNATYTSLMVSRFDTIQNIIDRRSPSVQSSKPLLMNSQSNSNLRNHLEVLNSSQIVYDQPLSPIEVAQKLAERIAKEKQANVASRSTSEQQYQQRRAEQAAAVAAAAVQQQSVVNQATLQVQQQQQVATVVPSSQQVVAAAAAQQVVSSQTVTQQQQVAAVQQIIQQQQQAAQAAAVAAQQTVAAAVAQQQAQVVQQQSHQLATQQQTVMQTLAGRQVLTPMRTIQQQQVTAAAVQQRGGSVTELVRGVPNVMAVSSQSGATVQVAAQQIRTSTVTTAVVMSSATQPIATTTRMITGTPGPKTLTPSQLQLYKQQQLRVKLIQQRGASPAASVIQASQATLTSPVTIRAQTSKPRTVMDPEMAALLKRQMLQQHQQQQQQKAAAAGGGATSSTATPVGTILAQAGGQGTSQVTTLVKTLPAQTSNVTNILPQVKTLSAAQLKNSQLRQFQVQQHLLAQRKLTATTTSQGKVVKTSTLPTQLIVQGTSKPTTMTVHHIQQVIKQMPHASTLNVNSSGGGQVISHAVITKSPQGTVQQRVIPVSTMSTAKQTIQVVTANTGQMREHVVRPGTFKVTTSQQQAIFSQVQAVFQQGQSIHMRQSPVRIQTSSGQPIVALAVSQGQTIAQMQVQQSQPSQQQQQQVQQQVQQQTQSPQIQQIHHPPDQT